ncbi:MAG: hypothetical protein WA970_13550, partial [Gammaproteobacteria bacterium]
VEARTARELYDSMFSVATLADQNRREATKDLRRLFLYIQTNLYHVHNAHDYWRDHILDDAEWITWKNLIRQMNAHPMLLTVIYEGYRNRYFSKKFGQFLKQELCDKVVPPHDPDPEGHKRGREFIGEFYPDMLADDWVNSLPDY